jgi:hypothetical protein
MEQSTVAVPAGTAQIRYDDLYARWERGNWVATELDFAQDRIDWEERLDDDQRAAALWIFSLFYHGEDAVADNLAPFVAAVTDADQRYFLATQQVDEARHAVFFKRFLNEVAGYGDGSVDGVLSATEEHLTWGHREAFRRLEEIAGALGSDPSPPRLAAAITLYHIVIEAAIAQPGQHVLDDALTSLDLMPGFRQGLEMVERDEQRHIAFGVKLLSELLTRDPEGVEAAIVELLAEILPATASFPGTDDWDPDYDRAIRLTAPLGFTLEDLYEASGRSFEDRLRAIGLRVDDIPRFPLALHLTPRERARAGLKLVHAGFLGSGQRPALNDPAALAYFFEETRRRADATQLPDGSVIQWDFTDADPWHLAFDGGTVQARSGTVRKPDIRLRSSLQDWVDLSAGRATAGRLLLTRRLRLRGKPSALARFGRVFA